LTACLASALAARLVSAVAARLASAVAARLASAVAARLVSALAALTAALACLTALSTQRPAGGVLGAASIIACAQQDDDQAQNVLRHVPSLSMEETDI
jgi:hypothetical protein